MSLMPDWAQQLAGFLPFQWTFGFPIEALIGQLPPTSCSAAWRCRSLWIAISATLVALAGGVAVRRFSAVGG